MRIHLIIGFIFLATLLSAQSKIDSLQQRLKVSTSDEDKINTLLKLSDIVSYDSIELGIIYAEQAAELAKEKGLTDLIAESNRQIGNYYYIDHKKEQAMKAWHKAFMLYGVAGNQLEAALLSKSIAHELAKEGDFEEAFKNYRKAIEIYKSIKKENELGYTYLSMGNSYKDANRYSDAINIYEEGLKIFKQLNDSGGISSVHNNLGLVYWRQGDLAKALEEFQISAKLREKLGDTYGMASSFTNMGIIHFYQEEIDKAQEYWEKALEIWKKIGNNAGIEETLNNLGAIYAAEKDYEKAIYYFNQSLEVKVKTGNKRGIAMTYSNIGSIFDMAGKSKMAYDYYLKAFNLSREINDRSSMAACFEYMGISQAHAGNIDLAKIYIDSAVTLSREIGEFQHVMKTYQTFSQALDSIKMPELAYQYYKQYVSWKDSLMTIDKEEKIAELQTLYETEKKEQELNLKSAELKQKDTDLKQKRYQNYALILGLCIVFLVVLLIARSYRIKKKANNLLAIKNTEIENKNRKLNEVNSKLSIQKEEMQAQAEQLAQIVSELEKSNLMISDSLHYAERIQKAIVTSEATLQTKYPDSFVIFKPKYIVSGDFLWFSSIENTSFIVSADCTGHGVPGAFMSMIGYTLLNEIIKQKREHSPAAILSTLGMRLNETLKHQNEEINDGMDVTICSVSEDKKITIASANQCFITISNGVLQEHWGDINSIGGFFSVSNKTEISEHKFENIDSLYLFSDGITDQFGGPKNEKFQLKKLKDLLGGISEETMAEQKKRIMSTFDEWKAGNTQLDDILVTGIRF